MPPKTRASRRSAARFRYRIEFVPSGRLALALLVWLGLACAHVYANVALPATSRIALIALLASTVSFIRRFVWLQGRRSIRALEWAGQDRFQIRLGNGGRRLPAIPEGCRRYGPGIWLLYFRTSEGRLGLAVDTRIQEPAALRRLSRSLDWGVTSASTVPGRP